LKKNLASVKGALYVMVVMDSNTNRLN
jgi:hypothetical protein